MKIILIGFMASGKSAVARTLSHLMELPLIEMDERVVAASKRRDVREIFSLDGEVAFRELEIRVARSLRKVTNAVISTGGGVVMNKIIIDYIKINGMVVFLAASFENILRRIGKEKTRPLFTDRESLKKLYNLRRPLYQAYGDVIVSTDGKPVESVAKEIIRAVSQH
jgi:shikimate kinase